MYAFQGKVFMKSLRTSDANGSTTTLQTHPCKFLPPVYLTKFQQSATLPVSLETS